MLTGTSYNNTRLLNPACKSLLRKTLIVHYLSQSTGSHRADCTCTEGEVCQYAPRVGQPGESRQSEEATQGWRKRQRVHTAPNSHLSNANATASSRPRSRGCFAIRIDFRCNHFCCTGMSTSKSLRYCSNWRRSCGFSWMLEFCIILERIKFPIHYFILIPQPVSPSDFSRLVVICYVQ